MESYRLASASNTAQYINNFLTLFQELKKIPGEAISESHGLSLFLRGVKDLDFEMTVEIQRNKYDNTLMMSDFYSKTREVDHEERSY